MINFLPNPQLTVNGAVTASSAAITVALTAGSNAVRLTNVGTQTVFWRFGTGTASVSTDTPMLANTVEVFEIPPQITSITAIAAAAGSTLYITPGIGS